MLAPAYAAGDSDRTLVVLVLVPEITGAAYAVVVLSRSLSRTADQTLTLLAHSLLAHTLLAHSLAAFARR